MHKHNLRVAMATRKWRVVSSHWLAADKAPDCTCRKSIDAIRIRASFLTNSSRGEVVGVSLQTASRKKNNHAAKQTRTNTDSRLSDGLISPPHLAFCCHSSHFVGVIEDQDRGAVDSERAAAAAALWEDSALGLLKALCSLGTERRRWSHSEIKVTHCFAFHSYAESKCQQMLKISWGRTSCWCSTCLWLPACALARSRMWAETHGPPGGAALFFKLFTATRSRL